MTTAAFLSSRTEKNWLQSNCQLRGTFWGYQTKEGQTRKGKVSHGGSTVSVGEWRTLPAVERSAAAIHRQ